MHAMGVDISGNSLSGRLSELAGAGYVKCIYTDVTLWDEESKQFKFRRTPIWIITPAGEAALEQPP